MAAPRVGTRGAAILDKINTNIQDWYEKPATLPNIGPSDHNALLMKAYEQWQCCNDSSA